MAAVGFVGLGLMGRPMAGHLLAAGHRLTVWNRTPARTGDLAARGARVAADPAGAAADADVVVVCVGDTPDVEAVLFGPAGVAAGAPAGCTVINSTTSDPAGEERFAARLAERGVRYLDAPVTGGQKGAVEGTLTFMVGGAAEDLDRVRDVLGCMGRKVLHAGAVGFGQKLKLINQLVCALHAVALSEAFALAEGLGLDLAQTRELLLSGAARSWALEIYGEKLLRRDFAPGFSLKWQAKDVRIALDAARSLGLGLPGLEAAAERLRSAVDRGHGEEGVQALVKLYPAKG